MKHQARTAMLVAAIAVGLGTAPMARAQSAWTTYQNTDFHFTVDVPAEPTISVGITESPAGPEPTFQGTIELSPDSALQLTAVDLTRVTVAIDPNAVLEGGVKGGVGAANATIDSETTISDGDAIGRDVVFHNGTVKYETRIFYLNRRVAALTGLGNGKLPDAFGRAAAAFKILP